MTFAPLVASANLLATSSLSVLKKPSAAVRAFVAAPSLPVAPWSGIPRRSKSCPPSPGSRPTAADYGDTPRPRPRPRLQDGTVVALNGDTHAIPFVKLVAMLLLLVASACHGDPLPGTHCAGLKQIAEDSRTQSVLRAWVVLNLESQPISHTELVWGDGMVPGLRWSRDFDPETVGLEGGFHPRLVGP